MQFTGAVPDAGIVLTNADVRRPRRWILTCSIRLIPAGFVLSVIYYVRPPFQSDKWPSSSVY